VRAALVVVGVIIVLMGAVFAGQGMGYIAGSVMTNDPKWIWIGGAMVVVGLALAIGSFRARPKKA
jgi:uncharacterized membrane protein YdcZ (DUF606 family)